MREPLRLNRRSFLLGSGGFALAIPFLPSLARAQSAAPKRYFLSWRISNGYFGHHWLPSDAATTGAMGLKLMEPNVREMPLANIQGPISPILDAGFDAYRSQMTLLRHIDHLSYETGHSQMTGLTG